jgi:uncharacterized protein YcfL
MCQGLQKTVLLEKLNFAMQKAVLIFFSLIILIGCKSDEKKPKALTQMQEVMAVHDDVMPKMGTLNSLINQLTEKAVDSEVKSQLENAIVDLKSANDGMMQWMQRFTDSFTYEEISKAASLSKEKQLLLDQEEVKIKEVSDQINNSIEAARKLLAKE